MLVHNTHTFTYTHYPLTIRGIDSATRHFHEICQSEDSPWSVPASFACIAYTHSCPSSCIAHYSMTLLLSHYSRLTSPRSDASLVTVPKLLKVKSEPKSAQPKTEVMNDDDDEVQFLKVVKTKTKSPPVMEELISLSESESDNDVSDDDDDDDDWSAFDDEDESQMPSPLPSPKTHTVSKKVI